VSEANVVRTPRLGIGRFDGRVALVTGAGSPTGIGFATARLLGAEGARVALTSTTDRIYGRVSRLESEGIDIAAFTADLTDESQAATLVDAVVERFGQIDVLVNNAGLAQSGVEDEPARQSPSSTPARSNATSRSTCGRRST
jgi:3-oxoacyl-[acyl-carrier protein] reductase